jgi:serine/threonine-protein kinase HipA
METLSMNMDEIQYCPGSLAEGFQTYSPSVLRRMFKGKRVSHILPFDSPDASEETMTLFLENRKRISISGVQEKISFLLDNDSLRPTKLEEQGAYILKPVPRDLMQVELVPANEHLTMQIASQVYGIQTAENVMLFFRNGKPAYITRRFDAINVRSKWGKEDFATLAGKSPDTAGPDFKYTGSYEEAAEIIRNYVAAWRIDMERYFEIIVFNYLFSNGDAHLKNFSLLEAASGEYRLSPAYDLINTNMHVNDTPFALDKGLFADNFGSDYFSRTHQRGWDDFLELGNRIGITDNRAVKMLEKFGEKKPGMEILIQHSFLSSKGKRAFLQHFQTRRNKFISK